MIVYFLSILISLTAAYLFIRLLADKPLNLLLHILLAMALGLGIEGTIGFYTHILFNQFNRFLPAALVLMLAGWLWWQKPRNPFQKIASATVSRPPGDPDLFKLGLGGLALILLAIPVAVSAHYYPLGGWDAWSCWNLKAKFIFLGQQNWKDVLAPDLWRSNTQYPLLWPLINVWSWDIGGKFDQNIPMFNGILITLLTAGLLIFGLMELTGMLLASLCAAVLVVALPFAVTLYTSQYSDSLLGLFLLSAFITLLLAEKYNLPKLKILSVVFFALMGFTKNEGLVSGCIAALLLGWHERSHKNELKVLTMAFLVALLPAIIFTIFFAPKNEAFINGLTSADKPTNWQRLVVIFVYPWFEFISAKWQGLWLLVFAGIILAGKKLWQSTLGVIGLSLVFYLGVVIVYYAVNTFFEIGWWLSTTLSRILLALVPTIVLWIAVGLKLKDA